MSTIKHVVALMKDLRAEWKTRAAYEVLKGIINNNAVSHDSVVSQFLDGGGENTDLKCDIITLQCALGQKERKIAELEAALEKYSPRQTVYISLPEQIDNKISLIKEVRAVSGLGLKEAKDWVEQNAGKRRVPLVLERGQERIAAGTLIADTNSGIVFHGTAAEEFNNDSSDAKDHCKDMSHDEGYNLGDILEAALKGKRAA